MYYLYKITNQLNSKVYIGQSNKEKERWRQHKYFARTNPVQYIHQAMSKYGIGNFTYEVIAVCRDSNDANETEKLLISQYNSRVKDYGYNLALGGVASWNRGLPKEQQPMYGKKQSEFQKQRMSEVHKGKVMPPCSEETKKKMSNKRLGRVLSKEWIEKISIGNRGKTRSEETKLKLSISQSNKTGENAPRSKLNWNIVNQIREKYKTGLFTQKELSKEYSVTESNINSILRNKSWIINNE